MEQAQGHLASVRWRQNLNHITYQYKLIESPSLNPYPLGYLPPTFKGK